jgi:hypothetical protein
MELRCHPAMAYHGVSNWPPVWTQRDGKETTTGEIGILKYVYAHPKQISNKCYLVIEHEKTPYIGCLVFNDPSFCARISAILREQTGRPIKQIGDLDLSQMLC